MSTAKVASDADFAGREVEVASDIDVVVVVEVARDAAVVVVATSVFTVCSTSEVGDTVEVSLAPQATNSASMDVARTRSKELFRRVTFFAMLHHTVQRRGYWPVAVMG